MTRARVATAAAPPEREQSFGGGGGDLLGLICPELGVAPLVDLGTDCEDELLIPAGPPAEVGHEMDSELEKVFIDVAETFVSDIVSSIAGVGGCLVCAPDVSRSSRAGGFHDVQCSADEPDSTGG